MYFRLVSEHESTASEVVLCEKPEITDDTNVIDPSILDSLVEVGGISFRICALCVTQSACLPLM